jgi:hypothetical protein
MSLVWISAGVVKPSQQVELHSWVDQDGQQGIHIAWVRHHGNIVAFFNCVGLTPIYHPGI